MYDNVCYKHSYLTEVIARVDFLSPIQGIHRSLPRELANKAKGSFPIPEPNKTMVRELRISPDEGVKSKETEATEWNFHSKDRRKTLTILPQAIFVRYTSYETFEQLRSDFLEMLNAFLDRFPDAQGIRSGLRYVNNISLDEAQPLSWQDYLHNDLIKLIEFCPEPEYLARLFHTLEFNFGDYNLRYRFGLHNPDFPAVIRRKVYTLDFDAYYQGIQERDEINANFDKFHIKIQQLFERSITDALRRKMNE